jgi:hypothetical protein
MTSDLYLYRAAKPLMDRKALNQAAASGYATTCSTEKP